jgi:yersiniabactin nonribosomal peptide synthetase
MTPAQLDRLAGAATHFSGTQLLLNEIFSSHAMVHSHRTAIVHKKHRLTYKEVDRLSNQVAHRLRVLGAHSDRVVGVMMKQGWEQVVATVGVLKSGAAYLQLNPDLPTDHIWYLLKRWHSTVVLTQPHLERGLRWPESIRPICLNETSRGSVYDRPLKTQQKPEDPICIAYDIGSNANKAAMLDHRGAADTVIAINNRLAIDPCDRVLTLSDSGMDRSVYDIFGSLAAAATMIIPDDCARVDPARLADLIKQEQVTVLNSGAALLEKLTLYASARNASDLESLRLVLLGSGRIPITLTAEIRALLPKMQLA